MPSDVAQRVIDMLAPALGEFLATGIVRAACSMSGTDIDSLDKSNLKTFADKIELTCKNLGPEVAKGIKEKVLTL